MNKQENSHPPSGFAVRGLIFALLCFRNIYEETRQFLSPLLAGGEGVRGWG
jgi:hypothetical protein